MPGAKKRAFGDGYGSSRRRHPNTFLKQLTMLVDYPSSTGQLIRMTQLTSHSWLVVGYQRNHRDSPKLSAGRNMTAPNDGGVYWKTHSCNAHGKAANVYTAGPDDEDDDGGGAFENDSESWAMVILIPAAVTTGSPTDAMGAQMFERINRGQVGRTVLTRVQAQDTYEVRRNISPLSGSDSRRSTCALVHIARDMTHQGHSDLLNAFILSFTTGCGDGLALIL